MAKGFKTGGRTAGTLNKRTQAILDEIASTGEMPLQYMLRIMRDPEAPAPRRDAMAIAAAPYVHSRLAQVDGTAHEKQNITGVRFWTREEWLARRDAQRQAGMRPLAPRTLRELHPRHPCGLPSTSACRRVFTDSSGSGALGAAKTLGELLKREPHRDFGQPAHWPQPDDAASRAMALDVRVALGGELLDGGVQWVNYAT